MEDDDEESLLVDIFACGFYSVSRFNVTQAVKDLYIGRDGKLFLYL